MFSIDPREAEPVSLLRRGREGSKVQVIAVFPRADQLNDTGPAVSEADDPLRPDAYRIDATFTKGLGFSAGAAGGPPARDRCGRGGRVPPPCRVPGRPRAGGPRGPPALSPTPTRSLPL